MLKKLFLGVLVLVSLMSAIIYVSYSSSRNKWIAESESNSQLIETPRGPIEYQILGDDGPYLLYAHGTPGGYDQGLSLSGMRVLTPSRPGYLRTPLSVGETPDEQAHAYAVLLDSLEIDQAFVLGISGGGPSAIAFAALYPERTTALIAIAAVSQPRPHLTFPEITFMRTDFRLWATATAIRSSFVRDRLVNVLLSDPESHPWFTTEELMSMWPSQRKAGEDNDEIQFRALDLLNGREITAPTLIIHGTDDTTVPFAQSELLADQIPTALLYGIEGGTHNFFSTHEEEIFGTTMEFIQSVAAATRGQEG